jgi:predicted O-methyltransferase YrrM
MDPSNASGKAGRTRALVVAESTDEATGTFGRSFEQVRVVTHEQVRAGTDTTGFDVVAVGGRDAVGFAQTLDVVMSGPPSVDTELLLDLGRGGERPLLAELLTGHQGLGVVGLSALGDGRVGVRIRRDQQGVPLDARLLEILMGAAALPTSTDAEARPPAFSSEVTRLERRTAHQRKRITELERRLERKRPRPAGAEEGSTSSPPVPSGTSLLSRAWRGYLAVVDLLLPSQRDASRRRRRITALAVAATGFVLAMVLPVVVALTGPDGLRDAVLVLLLEVLAVLLVIDLAYTRRIGASARAAAVAASQSREAGRRASQSAKQARQQVESLEQRTRRLRKQVVSQARAEAERLDALERTMTAQGEDQLLQHQALVNLFSLVRVPGALPPLGGWAASPDLALMLVDEIIRSRPRTVVECGSGSSTLLIALTARQYDLPTRVVSLEHDEHFARATRELLARHGVSEYAEVRHAPLRENSLPDHPAPWYDEDALRGVTDIGLLFVDGPPRSTGSLARLPAVPLLREQFAEQCTIILDDANRPDEQAVAERWAAQLTDFSTEAVSLQKGAVVLRRA